MLYVIRKGGKQILKDGWRALAIRYSDGHIKYMFGLGDFLERKIERIFDSIQPA